MTAQKTKVRGRIAVDIIESERGWGSKVDETKYFKTVEAAEKFIKEFNAQNTEPTAPDWYMRADGPFIR